MGATEFEFAMKAAAREDYIEIVKLCKEWGATEFNSALGRITAWDKSVYDVIHSKRKKRAKKFY